MALDSGEGVAHIPRHPLQELGLLSARQGSQLFLEVVELAHGSPRGLTRFYSEGPHSGDLLRSHRAVRSPLRMGRRNRALGVKDQPESAVDCGRIRLDPAGEE